ncbi:MAG: ceramidase domain-containing protein [Pseudomonadota bacterium]
MNEPLGSYCERAGIVGFWAEPVNAITNLAFILAAALCYTTAQREDRFDWPVILLTANLFIIGIGSFLFHTFSTLWAAMADSIPILVFILGFFAITMQRFVGLRWLMVGPAMLGFLAFFLGTSYVFNILLRDLIGGTVSYFPAMLAIFGVGWYLSKRSHPAVPGFYLAGGVFVVSLAMRAFDLPICGVFPLGTHFLWHVLNAVVLGTLIMTLIRHGLWTRRGPPAGATS